MGADAEVMLSCLERVGWGSDGYEEDTGKMVIWTVNGNRLVFTLFAFLDSHYGENRTLYKLITTTAFVGIAEKWWGERRHLVSKCVGFLQRLHR